MPTLLHSQDTMQVKWADPELQVKKKKAVDDSNADNRMVRVPFCIVCVCVHE